VNFRIDLLDVGGDDGEPEKIGIVFTDVPGVEDGVVCVDLTPEDALELAARVSETFALHKRWLDARETDPLAPQPTPLLRHQVTGLSPESWRLRELLSAGYALKDAEVLAKDQSIDLHKAVDLANDAGAAKAAEILL
jgi:hypothetical protein